MRGVLVAASLALFASSPTSATTQSALAVEVGFLTAFEDAVFQFGIRSTALKPGGVGVDFSLATLPEAIAEGVFFVMPNLDLAWAMPVGSRSWIMPRFGVSALVGAGEGAGAIPGFNFGIGLLGRMGEKMGARMDVTHQRYLSEGESVGFTALTFGIAWMQQ